jgi:predicted N-formylglutamate amidohydrolase
VTATPPHANDTRSIRWTAEPAQVESRSSDSGTERGDLRRGETLLSADDADAVEIVNPGGAGTAVLVCDHASNRIPQRLGTLGLGARALEDHIAWDPGAADVARHLSSLLDAPLVSSGYSRLVIDCNRPLDSPESIPVHTGGVQVPGNRELAERERALRTDALFRPYHRAITELLDRRSGRASVLLSIHSFAPVLAGRPRPWSIGLASGRDRRLAALLLEEMKRDPGLVVGDNEPYDVDDAIDYTIPVHGEGRGLPHVLIEIRQDTLEAPEQAARWAARLARAFRAVEPAALRFCATTGA